MKKAVFLDRDGVINRETGKYIFKKEELVINDGVVGSLNQLMDAGFLLIVISNQGGISRGLYKKEDTEVLHTLIKDTLKNEGVKITEFYYCTHHHEVEKCLCRKPAALMLEKAIARFGIDAGSSWFIGDNERDAEAARSAGVRPVKVMPNEHLGQVCEMIISHGT